MSGPLVILILKIAVIAVTLILLGSLLALWRGAYWLHGRLNLAFFTLTLIAVLGLEFIVRLINPHLFDELKDTQIFTIHLCFAVPSLVVMPAMLYTGLTHRRAIHLGLAVLFSILWIGTFITGVFFL